jgi:cytosine/adenosine deaminase-related metal-dependent hydrolase
METQYAPTADASVLEQLVSDDSGAAKRTLISGATLLTMDPDVGNFAQGDLLIEGDKIVSVGEDLSEAAGDGQAIRIDATGRIAIPGFQDTHRHCWQNQLRRLIPDCDDNKAYLDVTHNWLGQIYRPEDIYVGNLISALGAIETGTTCVLDFFHNPRTPEHSDAAILAFRDAGIRSTHVSCGPLTGEWDRSWPADVKRVRDHYFNTTDQLSTLRLGAIGAEFAPEHIALNPERVRSALELGIDFVSDGVVGPPCSRKVRELADAGLLGPHLMLIHCLDLSGEAWQLIADSGTHVSLPTTSDTNIGIYESVPAVQKAVDFGIRPSLSVDVEVCLTSDMFTQMRTLYSIQRMRVFERRYQGLDYAAPLGVKDILQFATVEGARGNGVLHKAGTLTPGKEADVVLINANDFNTMPLNNAYGSIVSAADTRNVEAVFIAGKVKKFAGELVGCDRQAVMRRVYASRDYLLKTAGFDLDIFEQKVGFLAPGAQPSLRPE